MANETTKPPGTPGEDAAGLPGKRDEPTRGVAEIADQGGGSRPPAPGMPDLSSADDVQQTRITTGYVYSALGILLFLFVIEHVFSELHQLHVPPDSATPVYVHPFAYVKFGAHAAVIAVLVWFSYQLLRAGERLMLPWWWASTNIEVARAMLGISDPFRAAARMSIKMARDILSVVKEAVKVGGKTPSEPED